LNRLPRTDHERRKESSQTVVYSCVSVERLSPASIDRLLGRVDGCAAYRRQNTAIFEQVATEMVARARIAAADRHLRRSSSCTNESFCKLTFPLALGGGYISPPRSVLSRRGSGPLCNARFCRPTREPRPNPARDWFIRFAGLSSVTNTHTDRPRYSCSNSPHLCYAYGWLGSRVVSVLDSSVVGPRIKSQSRRCRVTVLGKLFTPIVPLFTKQQNW